MTKDELILKLKECEKISLYDEESGHIFADLALLNFINDAEIAEAFKQVKKWYA